MVEALIETRPRYQHQVSDLGGETDEDAATNDSSLDEEDEKRRHHHYTIHQSLSPPLSPRTFNADEDGDDDASFGVQISVETHLLKDDNRSSSLRVDSFEDEASIRSWKSLRSWPARGRHKGPPPLPPTSPPRVEVYVDVQEPLRRPLSKTSTTILNSTSTSTTHTLPEGAQSPIECVPLTATSGQDLGRLLALVPSVDHEVMETPDAFSIQSQTVFTRDDFNKTHWLSALTTNSGYLGLAVIAVTISIAHPLLFLAAAAAALGTATAVGASYDYFLDCAPCCSPDPALTTPTPTTIAATTPEESISATNDNKHNAANEVTTVVAPSVLTTIAAPTSNARVQTPSPPPSTTTTAITPQGALPPDWLEWHYPALEFVVVQRQALEGLNVVQFFDVFFSDSAPYNFKEFQIQRGDKQVEYGAWKPVVSNENIAFPPLSMHPVAVPYPSALEYQQWLERQLHFQAKTNNTLIGPPYATTTKRQRILIVSKKLAVLEMKTTLADIPFCDRFYVLERWLLKADKDADGVYHLEINSQASIVFVKSCPFASQIQSKSRSSLQDVGKAWCHMATQALKLTKQAKANRAKDDKKDANDKSPVEIKNETAGSRQESEPLSGSKETTAYTEEKKEDEIPPFKPLHKEGVELMHNFTRQTSWVEGERPLEQEPIAQRSRSLRRFLPGRRGASVGPKPTSPNRLGHKNSAVF